MKRVAVVLLALWTAAPALAEDAALERLGELEKQLKENRDRLAEHESRSRELLDSLQTSEKRRAQLQTDIRAAKRALEELRQEERRLRTEIARLERVLAKAEADARTTAAWTLSLTRGGTMELLLSGVSPSDRLRQSGLLRTTLANIENYARQVATDLADLEASRERLEGNIAAQETQNRRLQEAVGEVESRDAQLRRTLNLVRNDAALTQRLIDDLELARRELTRIISESRRGRRDLLALDSYKNAMKHPTAGELLMGFGQQIDPVFGVPIEHPGWTYRVAKGTPVVAVAPGEVVYVGWLRGYGNLVVLRHGNEYFSLYGYLEETLVQQGGDVGEGQPIGLSGDSGSLYGPALHFEIRQGKDPLDPAEWLAR